MKRRHPPEWARKKRPRAGAEYEVGYARPPKSTQFKPGHAGRGGRPRGSKNKRRLFSADLLQSTVLGEAGRRIKLNEAGKPITLSVLQAAVRAMGVAAVKGHPLAQRSFVRIVEAAEQAKNAGDQDYLDTVLGYKAYWEEELNRRRVLGISAPDPIPHPDDIIIDPRAGTITIMGPMTAEEKPKWDKVRKMMKDLEDEAAWLRAEAQRTDDEEIRALILEDAKHDDETRERIASIVLERMAHRA
jgi:hypothetical protein